MKHLALCSNPARGNGFAGRGRMGLDNGHVPGMWTINYLDSSPCWAWAESIPWSPPVSH